MSKGEFRRPDGEPCELSILAPTLDVVQDHPAALDWRWIVAFLVAALAALYV